MLNFVTERNIFQLRSLEEGHSDTSDELQELQVGQPGILQLRFCILLSDDPFLASSIEFVHLTFGNVDPHVLYDEALGIVWEYPLGLLSLDIILFLVQIEDCLDRVLVHR